MTTDKPHGRDLLPACVLDSGPEAVRQTEQTFRDALDTLDSARQDARKAVEAAEAAPDADARADLDATRAGRKLPKPSVPDKERERDAAQRLVAVATQEATATRSLRDDAIAAHRDQLIATLGGRVADTRAEAFDGIDRHAVLLDTLGVETAALAALPRGDRRWHDGSKTPGGAQVAALLQELRAARRGPSPSRPT